MEERRRQTRRSLKTLPATETELLWEIREEVAVLTERMDNHLAQHKSEERTTAKTTDLVLVKIGIGVAIVSPFVTHILMNLGK